MGKKFVITEGRDRNKAFLAREYAQTVLDIQQLERKINENKKLERK